MSCARILRLRRDSARVDMSSVLASLAAVIPATVGAIARSMTYKPCSFLVSAEKARRYWIIFVSSMLGTIIRHGFFFKKFLLSDLQSIKMGV